MAEPRRVTDEEIVSRFTSLQEAMIAGFARMEAQFSAAIAASEQRMLRRFDHVEQRFDKLEQRFDTLEQRFSLVEHGLGAVERQLAGLGNSAL